MTTIAPLTATDRPEWESLWSGYLAFYRHSLTPEQTDLAFARVTGSGPNMWGALARDADGNAIGLVHWLTHLSTWEREPLVYLEDLFVTPDVRGTGVGRALIAHVTNWAHEHGHPKVYWQTEIGNSTARRLYDNVAEHKFVVYEINQP